MNTFIKIMNTFICIFKFSNDHNIKLIQESILYFIKQNAPQQHRNTATIVPKIPPNFERILSNIIAIIFGKYFSILRTFGYLFWQLPEKCTFWDFGLKSGDFEHQNLQKGADQPQYGDSFWRKLQAGVKFFGIFWFFWVSDYFELF